MTQSTAVTKSFSLADAVVSFAPVDLDSQPARVRDGLAQIPLAAMRGWMPEFYGTLYGQDPADGQYYLRLMLRVHERQSAQRNSS